MYEQTNPCALFILAFLIRRHLIEFHKHLHLHLRSTGAYAYALPN